MLPTLRFSREFGLVFFVDLRLFWRLAACLFLGMFWLKFACFLGLFFCSFLFCGFLFFFKFHGTFALQFTSKQNLGVFLCKFAHFGLVFSDFPRCLCIKLTRCFIFFWIFLTSANWACFSVKLPIWGLFSKFSCLFLQHILASLPWRNQCCHCCFFSLDLFFFCFIWGSAVFIENLGRFDSGQILEMHVVLLYFPFKNTVVSHAQCAESVTSTVE